MLFKIFNTEEKKEKRKKPFKTNFHFLKFYD